MADHFVWLFVWFLRSFFNTNSYFIKKKLCKWYFVVGVEEKRYFHILAPKFMDKKKKTLLITGGTGYIWSHAVVAFEQAWYSTVMVDNFVNSSPNSLNWIEKILWYRPDFYECDIRDKDWLRSIFGKYQFDGVIHFAAKKFVSESITDPIEYYDNNVSWSITLFQIMDEFHVSRCIFSSTAWVYDSDNLRPPFSENDAKRMIHPYANSKFIVENVLEQLAATGHISSISLRYFNVIGAHESECIWDDYFSTETNVIGYIYKTFLWKQKEFLLYGNNFHTPDGTAVRDYIDILDLIRGHIDAYRYIESNPTQYIPINLGTWWGVSVLELVHTSEYILKKKLPICIMKQRVGDVGVSVASTERAKKILGWSSNVPLTVSIQNGWNYLQKRRD